jgi:hypothetical protein
MHRPYAKTGNPIPVVGLYSKLSKSRKNKENFNCQIQETNHRFADLLTLLSDPYSSPDPTYHGSGSYPGGLKFLQMLINSKDPDPDPPRPESTT